MAANSESPDAASITARMISGEIGTDTPAARPRESAWPRKSSGEN